MGLYFFTMVLAVATGLILVNVFQPGATSNLLETEFFERAITGRGELREYSSLPAFLLETLNQVLANPFESLAHGRILPIVVFAILLGIALLQIGASARGFVDMIGAGYQAIMKIIGWIIRLAPALDPVTRTFKVEAEIDNSQRLLRPGMFVEVTLIAELREDVPVVPREAVAERGGVKVVFVLSGQQVEQREVIIGLGDDEIVEIRSGLEPGERVVVKGLETLSDESKVRVSGA